MKRKFPRFAASALAEEEPSLPWQSAANVHQEEVEQLPEAGPSRPIWDHIRPPRTLPHLDRLLLSCDLLSQTKGTFSLS